mmetsp:Transcript_1611/g.2844  ORF Transcript_1611/g.2844 Transcript_1611/m.2844 type:complete len:155 (+) Transcript_1611:285-749(+)
MNDIAQLTFRSIFCYISIYFTDLRKSPLPFIYMALFSFVIVECPRYAFFALKVLGAEQSKFGRVLGHLKHNLFIILYPMGALGDLMTGVYGVENIRRAKAFSVEMPNSLNIAFDYAFVMQWIIPAIYILGFPLNYKLLLSARRKYYEQTKTKQA